MAHIAIKLAAAHFIAWTLVQGRSWPAKPADNRQTLKQGLAGAAVYTALALLFLQPSDGRPAGAYAVLLLVVLSALIRLELSAIAARLLPRSWWTLLIEQTAVLAVIMLTAACTLAAGGSAGPLRDLSRYAYAVIDGPQTYAVLSAYAVSLGLGAAIVRLVTSTLPARSKEEHVGLDGAGSIIGILERLLVTSFVLFWPSYGAAAIGLIFSAKSIARFPEMGKEDGTRFAEYYLVGTLTSFAVAIGAGMIARRLLLA